MRFTNKISFGIALFLLTVPLFGRTYSTTFPATENPISEGGNWTSGSAAGNCGGTPCYYDIRTTTNFAFGTMPVGAGARDSTAILTGTWGLNQTVTATTSWTNFTGGELELRLRSSLVAGGLSYGYEVLFNNGYCQIVRWEGQVATLGGSAYTALYTNMSCPKAPVAGSVLKATAVSTDSGTTTTITAWIDGTQIMTVKDSGQGTHGSPAINDAFCSTHVCNPGMGTFINGGGTNSGTFGFSRFTATDDGSVPPPSGLNAVVK
jgi:hypothetical protein